MKAELWVCRFLGSQKARPRESVITTVVVLCQERARKKEKVPHPLCFPYSLGKCVWVLIGR